jgi:oligopeptide/dipeptide ABC transporter ATP-binding protein
MYAGQIVEQAPTTRLFASVRMPYTEALLRSIPTLDLPRGRPLQAIPGRPPNLVSPPKAAASPRAAPTPRTVAGRRPRR